MKRNMFNEEFITGYQWSPDDNKFMGEYKFPNNKDKEDIHLPPFTTLEKPPEVTDTTSAYWENNNWIIKEDLSKLKTHTEIDNYEMLMPDYIDWLKSQNLWANDDEKKYSDAQQKKKEREEEEIRKQKEIEESTDYWQVFRTVRNFKLQETDWTQLPDVQNILSKEEKLKWETYRQELRDLSDVITDPKPLALDSEHPNWPKVPA
jgi:sulfur relay (sulfurtransferase) DsrC/TusE family protein